MASDFEEFMAPRFEKWRNDEGVKVVLELWDGRKLEDAVLDAIESLPAGKTKRLRAWVSQAGDYSEWRALEREGWQLEITWRSAFPRPDDRFLVSPPSSDWKPTVGFFDRLGEALAAAVGADAVGYIGKAKTGELVFSVIK